MWQVWHSCIYILPLAAHVSIYTMLLCEKPQKMVQHMSQKNKRLQWRRTQSQRQSAAGCYRVRVQSSLTTVWRLNPLLPLHHHQSHRRVVMGLLSIIHVLSVCIICMCFTYVQCICDATTCAWRASTATQRDQGMSPGGTAPVGGRNTGCAGNVVHRSHN